MSGTAARAAKLREAPSETDFVKSFKRHADGGGEIDLQTGWTILFSSEEGARLPADPKPGTVVRTWGKGFGFPIRGLQVGDHVLRYRTIKQQEQLEEKQRDDIQQKRRDEFQKQKAKLDADYATLPPVFKQRIDFFRGQHKDWRIDFEAYEMSVCVDAVKIANTFNTVEEILAFAKLPYEDQKKQVSLFDGHSGNSFAASVYLAKTYKSDYKMVPKAHGALCVLVGCKHYGCYAGTLPRNKKAGAEARSR